MYKILTSFVLALAMFIGAALPRFNDTPQAQGVRQDIVFGDGAHKNWKLAVEQFEEHED